MWMELTNDKTKQKVAVNFDHVRRFRSFEREQTVIIYEEDDNPNNDSDYTLVVEETYDFIVDRMKNHTSWLAGRPLK